MIKFSFPHMEKATLNRKACTRCKAVKNLAEFSKRARSKDGLQPICKSCSKKVSSAWHVENRDVEIAKHRLYYAEHRSPDVIPLAVLQQRVQERLASKRKLCTRCGITKPFSGFNKHSGSSDGLQGYCKKCEREINFDKTAKRIKDRPPRIRKIRDKEKEKAYATAWAKANPEKRLQISRRHRARNLGRVRASNAKWSAKNTDKINLKKAQWRARNPASARSYRQRNKASINENTRQRRAQLNGAAVAWANTGKIIAFYVEAERLTVLTGIKHEVDHVAPLRSRLVCGLHCEDNLQILTKIQNLKKGNKFQA